MGERTRNVGVFEDRLWCDDGERGRVAVMRREMDEAAAEHVTWADVDRAIGSANGAICRQHAQEITLKEFVALTNKQLGMLSPRYRLARGDGLLDVADKEMKGEVVASRGLSGGERFLVSLGLALALSGLDGRQGSYDVLLVDETFGSSTPAAWTSLSRRWRRCRAVAARLASSPTSRPWWNVSQPRSGLPSVEADEAW